MRVVGRSRRAIAAAPTGPPAKNGRAAPPSRSFAARFSGRGGVGWGEKEPAEAGERTDEGRASGRFYRSGESKEEVGRRTARARPLKLV